MYGLSPKHRCCNFQSAVTMDRVFKEIEKLVCLKKKEFIRDLDQKKKHFPRITIAKTLNSLDTASQYSINIYSIEDTLV